MAINNYTTNSILNRIVLVLPSRFSIATGNNIVNFLTGISEALKINTDLIDELFKQTNLVSASGEYVDEYITDLADIGRINGETDEEYKTRFKNRIYKYNSTKQGLTYVVVDFNGTAPYQMYNLNKRGAFFGSGYFYDDSTFLSEYGDASPSSFTGYIEFGRKPNPDIFDEMCKTIADSKAAGTKVYLKYPLGDNLMDTFTGSGERVSIT